MFSLLLEKNLEQYACETAPQVKIKNRQHRKDVEDTRGFAAMKDEITKVDIYSFSKIKVRRWVSANAKVFCTHSKCIDQIDRELVDHFQTAKEQWDSLFLKYSKSSANSRKQDLHQITNLSLG